MKVIALVFIVFVTSELVDGFRKCTYDQYYVERNGGRCRRCKPCRAGYEFDETMKRNISKQYGYMECPDCIICQDGYYREAKSNIPSCSRCVLNCALLFRYQVEQCGGTRKGGCGDCMLGYTAKSADINSFCEPLTTTTTTTASPSSKTSISSHIKLTKIENTASFQAEYHPKVGGSHDHTTNTPKDLLMNVVIGVLICAAIAMLVVFVLWRKGYLQRNRSDEESHTSKHPVERKVHRAYNQHDLVNESSSKSGLLSSNGSNLGNDNDLEIDGVGQSGQRGEMPLIIEYLDQPECIHPQISGIFIADGNGKRDRIEYPTHRVSKTDSCLDIVANKIYGERVNEVFRYLHMEPPKVEPHRELWMNGKQKYAEFVLQVLINWVQTKGNEATFDKLCSALEMADFRNVINLIVDTEQNASNSISEDGDTQVSNITANI